MKVLLASIKADIEIFPVNQGSVGRDVFNYIGMIRDDINGRTTYSFWTLDFGRR